MKIETQNIENHEAKIIIELSAEEFEPLKNQAARKIAGQAKIPGFRPGKAPYDIIRRNYGDAAIAQEALDIFLEKQYEQVLKEAAVEPGGMGRLDKVDQIDPPKLSILVPLASTVDLGDYRDIREEYEEPTVTEEELADTLLQLKKPYAVAEPAEGPAEKGQSVYVLIKAEIESPTEDDPNAMKELVKEMPYEFVIGDDTDKESAWPYVDFTQTLIGAKEGDVVTSEHIFPEETPVATMRGKKGIFTTTIQSIKKLVLPEEDLEFTKNYGEFESYQAFVNDVQERLLEQKKHAQEDAYIEKVMTKIVEQADFKYAPNALEEAAQEVMDDFKHRLSHQNLDLETYLKLQKKEMETFLDEEIKPSAENKLKRKLVLQEIAEKEKIRIDFEKFKEMISQFEASSAAQYQQAKTKRQKEELTNQITTSAMNQTFNDALFSRIIAIAKGENPEIEAEAEESAETIETSPAVTVDEAVRVGSDEVISADTAEETTKDEE